MKARGFTLVEMLIAISLLTLLAGLAYGTLRTGIRSWDVANLRAERGDALKVAWPYLHRTLQTARPVRATQTDQVRFDGGTQELVWITELPSHLAGSGARQVRLYSHREPGSDTPQLRLSHHDLEATSFDAADNQQAVLVERLQQLQLQYYGPPEGGGAAAWHDEWLQRDRLPTLVRIAIQPVGERPWPTLYARLRLALPGVASDEDEDADQ